LSSALDASPLVEYEQARAEDAPATEADTSRAQSELGWTPRAALAESVAELAYWCRDYYGPGNHGLGNGE
jgi:UDP-glucose 4-epimerase